MAHELQGFGQSIQTMHFSTVHASRGNIASNQCENTTVIELAVYGTTYNEVVLREDLVQGGQRIVEYALDYFNYQEWINFGGTSIGGNTTTKIHGKSVGNLLVDWVDPPKQPSTIIRMRCIRALEIPIYLKSVSVHTGIRPSSNSTTTTSNTGVVGSAYDQLI